MPQPLDYDFMTKLHQSKGMRQPSDIYTIKGMLSGCVEVRTGTQREDRQGIDYVATLYSGVEINIDVKTREPGASRWWKNRLGVPDGEPDVAIERWSVVPTAYHDGAIGWSLDAEKRTDYILYTFDVTDHKHCYLIPFQLLRTTVRRDWKYLLSQFGRRGRLSYQSTDGGRYQSACLFVPISALFSLMQRRSKVQYVDDPMNQIRMKF